jgi:hypothetical protein
MFPTRNSTSATTVSNDHTPWSSHSALPFQRLHFNIRDFLPDTNFMPQNRQDGLPGSTRARRSVAETGSFGKSTRRSRSRTGTPARRENPTLAAADKIFGDWISNQASAPTSTATTPQPQRKSSGLSTQPALLADDAAVGSSGTPRLVKSEPTEVILRGYRSSMQQYAAINHYEQLAGRICEDYSREPPMEQRRYKSELRDTAFTRRKPLTSEERAKVNRADGGEHWVKVTFESADAADAALFASPQRILGYMVYAEIYHGMSPTKDEAVPDMDSLVPVEDHHSRSRSVPATGAATPKFGDISKGSASTLRGFGRLSDLSPPTSHTSSQTIGTGTLSTSGASSATVAIGTLNASAPLPGASDTDLRSSTGVSIPDEDSIFCRRIPTARKVKLISADQALLPQPSYTQRVLNKVPFLKWFSGSMIGNEVPRTDLGDFDWNRASLYWKVIWWLDSTFGLFGGEIVSADKDD